MEFKPRVFIGSSSERFDVAKKISDLISDIAMPAPVIRSLPPVKPQLCRNVMLRLQRRIGPSKAILLTMTDISKMKH